MTSFTGTVSDGKNQIGVYSPQVDNSKSLLLQAATTLGGSIIEGIKKNSDESRLGKIGDSALKEVEKLSAMREQGNINSKEFYTRLNAHMRSVQADNPSLAGKIRERFREDLGFDATQAAVKENVDTFKEQEDLNKRIFEEAQTQGFAVIGKDGKPDMEKSNKAYTNFVRHLNNAKLIAADAKEDNSKARSMEVYGRIQDSMNEGMIPLVTQIQADLKAAIGTPDEAKALGMARNKFSEASRQFTLLSSQALNGSKLGVDEDKKNREAVKQQLDTLQELLFSKNDKIDTSVAGERMRTIQSAVDTMQVDYSEVAAPFISMEKVMGPEAVKGVVQEFAVANKIELSSMVKRAGTFYDHAKTASDIMTGNKDINSLAPEDKTKHAKAGQAIIENVSKKREPSTQDLSDMIGASNNIVLGAALASDSIKTKAGALRILSTPSTQAAIAKASADSGLSEKTKVLNEGINQLSTDMLKQSKGNLAAITKTHHNADVLYNPTKGVFEVSGFKAMTDNSVLTPLLPGGFSSRNAELRNIKPFVDDLNNALRSYASSSKAMLGDKYSDAELRQHAVDTYGYKTDPRYQKSAPIEIKPTSSAAPIAPTPATKSTPGKVTFLGFE